MRRITLLPLCLLGCLLSVAHPCGAQTDFDIGNKEGLSRNPAGVRLLLRTTDGRLTFHLFETIPVELNFSSSRPSTYSIELDESMNFAGWTHTFEVEPEKTVLLTLLERGLRGVICCDSDRRSLSHHPTVLKRELTDYLRFEKAGTYRLYLTTRRVFKGERKYDDFSASKILLTSNILTLTILPDDPEWDAQRLAETLRKLHDPHVKANYDALKHAIDSIGSSSRKFVAEANRLNQTELVQAQKALNALDTPEAIRERMNLMNIMPKEETSSEGDFVGGIELWQPLLASSMRPDLVIAAMEARAEDPDFGVDYDYVVWWARYIVARDHVELFRPFLDETDHHKRLHPSLESEVAAKRDIVLRLELLLALKKGGAKDITAVTIKTVKADIADQNKGNSHPPASF
jgi:hypothetical protein